MTKLFGVTVSHGLSSENRVFATLLAAREERYEALVVVHHDDDGAEDVPARFAALSRGTTVSLDTGWRPNPLSHRADPRRLLVALRYLRRIDAVVAEANDYGPDVVYSSQQHYDCRAVSKVARSLDVPQIVHLHYTVGPWLRRTVLDRLRTADHVVAVSDFIRQQAIGHGVLEDRITTIRNTVDPHTPADPRRTTELRTELGIADDQYVFGMVSRLDPSKGHFDAISAFEHVARRRGDSVLVIVGSGRIERRVLARAQRSPAADRIVVTGQRSDVPDLLSTFDALVHPASEDPCPLAVLEAMAAALPVVGYHDGGLPELVVDGSTGILVRDAQVDDLAESMLALRNDTAASREFGAAGARRIASDFDPAPAGATFAELVRSMS